jgi:FkbM family methyltransferase
MSYNSMFDLFSETSELMESALLGKKLVFDIGAHKGTFSRQFAKHGAQVHAYEPIPDIYSQLIQVEGIIPHKFAMSDEPGKLKNVSVFNCWTLMPVGSPRDISIDYKDKPGFDCDVTTLDIEASRYGVPDFIKIDVDGYEGKVLRGGIKTLERAKCPIMFEFSYVPTFLHENMDEMCRLIYSLGYQAWSMDGKYCAKGVQEMFSNLPWHSSYDVMLVHKDNPVP